MVVGSNPAVPKNTPEITDKKKYWVFIVCDLFWFSTYIIIIEKKYEY